MNIFCKNNLELYDSLAIKFEEWSRGEYKSFDPFFPNHLTPCINLENYEGYIVAQLSFKAQKDKTVTASLRDIYLMEAEYSSDTVYENSTDGWLHKIKEQTKEEFIPLKKLEEIQKGDLILTNGKIKYYYHSLCDLPNIM